jgi:hypothetical protein
MMTVRLLSAEQHESQGGRAWQVVLDIPTGMKKKAVVVLTLPPNQGQS